MKLNSDSYYYIAAIVSVLFVWITYYLFGRKLK